jgi:hypothetical protein
MDFKREISWGVVDWIHLAQHSEQWRTVVKAELSGSVISWDITG